MKKISLTLLFLIQAVALLVLTCGRNGPLPPPDKTPPAVATIVPADGEEVVPINTSIMITFNKEMNLSTINNKTIYVSSYGGVAVAGTVSATGMTAVFKPTTLLAQNTHYSITIDGTVMDSYGIPMGSPAVFSFWTETLPSVVSHLPGSSVIEVPVNSTINVVFSEPVDPTSINLTLLSAITGTVACTMTTLDNVSYTFTPVIPFGAVYGLTGNTLYTAIVHAGVVDYYGKVMLQDFTWSFTTALAPDTTPPVVSAVTPTNGSSNVSVSTGITVTFSELLTSQSMTVLLSGGTGAPITCIQDGENTTVNQTIAYFAPLFPPTPGRLEYNTLYSATLLNNGVMDLSGIHMSANYVWTFTTALATTSTIISAPSIAFGSNGIVTVSVSADDQTAGAPTGNVWLSVDNQSSTQQSLAPGAGATATATFTIINPSSGSHALAATYQTQGIFSASTGTSILTVNAGAGTTTTLQSSINPSAFGQSVTFTATVTPGATGTVWFTDASTSPTTTLGSGTLSRGNPNTATFSTSSLAAGAHLIIARYAGDANLPGSQSAPLTQTVVNASSTTNLVQSPASAVYGTNVTFTATVTGPGGTPTGTVTFSDGATTLGQVTLSAAGTAAYSTTALTGGQHTITATYGGDASYGQSSKSVVHTVTNQPTTTGPVTSSANPSVFGSSITFTAAVTSNPTGGTPSGTVTFSNGGSWTASAALSNGSASVSTSALPYGPNSITASFNPNNTYYATSTSAALVQNVNPVITASAGTGGSISPSGAVTVAYGTNQTFSITPTAGYSIANLVIDGVTQGAATSYTFPAVTANHTIVANFVINKFTITPGSGPNGSINPATQQIVSYGSNTTFAFTPNSGYFISAVTVDGVSVGLPTSYTFINVVSNHTISVSFALGTNIITATANAGGTINSQGVIVSSGTSQDFLVANGGSRSFTITPNVGYSIASVLVDGALQSPTPTSYTFSNVTGSHTIVANFVINTFTINPSAGANGSISPATAQVVSYGSSTTFTITPNSGYSIANVLVDGNSVGAVASYTFNNVTGNHTISATFGLNPTITASAGAGGSITPSGSVIVSYGSSTTFTITPNGSYHIVDVLVDGSSVGAVASYTFNNVTGNHSISASFSINTFSITASAGTGGSITPSGTVIVSTGTSTTFTITPNTNYHIVDVQVDGSSQGPVTSWAFNNITANHTINASFAINTFTINASAGAGGGISPSGAVMVSAGTSTTFTITPNTGYHIVDVQVDGGSVGAVSSYPFNNVTANHTISASFAINTFTINPSAGANGSISPATAQVVSYGSSTTFTITPNSGYSIANVLVDGNSVGAVASYTFNNVTGNHTISATFGSNATISASAGTGGSITPSGSVIVSYGSSTTFTITPNTGYHIVDVLVDGGSVGAVTSYPFNNVTANHTISASFAINTFTITTIATGCTVTPQNPSVPYNANQTFTITPNTGYHLVDVLVDGYSVGAVSSYTFTKVKDVHTIEADCAINTYTITASAGTGGSITPSGNTTLNYNGSQTFTITPNSGYSVLDVLVDGSSVGAVTSYPFNNVTGNHTISATFVQNPIIQASADLNGTISPTGAVTVPYNGSQTFTISPNGSHTILDVQVDTVSVGAVASYTFNNVTINHSISATFQ